MTVHFRSVSKNYYNYGKALVIHTNNQEGDIWNGCASPVPMITNIENGFGIFAGYSTDTVTISKSITR